ncbi:PREDICTED: tetratricopeptide repeat protein 28-like [Acropora digitifera]|uniref:tetratricopeptide repeat protein 28-like n=1 Tax=Acropora digitifera TaxID=70779 RepID=UPI00077A778F|nr:PREDICTED: tetratricopeptide repeat protein 28-like [Acropora digitifera]
MDFSSLEQMEKALDNFAFAVDAFNSLRSQLKSKDDWKMKFRELHEAAYTALWMSLLKIEKVEEALVAAENGGAQTLSDNLCIQYELNASSSSATIDSKETILRLFAKRSSPILFLAIEGFTINIWFLKGKKVEFRTGRMEGDRRQKDPLRALLQSSLEAIGATHTKICEDHDELVIVSNGALCFTPWAAVIESIRIRTVPSLTSYHLILSVPEGHHNKKGALLVGNPCLKELEKPAVDLPCAHEEVEMIASILKTRPLIGTHATKAEVMKRMSSVGLIHIAAHGNKHTGEIALSPNPGWSSKFPQREDYILKMSDVQAANLRARLVVLSCCHSGRGRLLKGEGVVGIARAFLAAGARSVLVALWAIDDEATMVFMKSFYQHLKEGKSASVAVQQSMKFFREQFSETRYWAPFQLIGDDVKIEFEVDDDVKK